MKFIKCGLKTLQKLILKRGPACAFRLRGSEGVSRPCQRESQVVREPWRSWFYGAAVHSVHSGPRTALTGVCHMQIYIPSIKAPLQARRETWTGESEQETYEERRGMKWKKKKKNKVRQRAGTKLSWRAMRESGKVSSLSFTRLWSGGPVSEDLKHWFHMSPSLWKWRTFYRTVVILGLFK